MTLRRLCASVSAVLGAAGLVASVPAHPAHSAVGADPRSLAARGTFAIVENRGQFDPMVRFQARTDGMTMWVTDRSLWITWLGSGGRRLSPIDGQLQAPPEPCSPLPEPILPRQVFVGASMSRSLILDAVQ